MAALPPPGRLRHYESLSLQSVSVILTILVCVYTGCSSTTTIPYGILILVTLCCGHDDNICGLCLFPLLTTFPGWTSAFCLPFASPAAAYRHYALYLRACSRPADHYRSVGSRTIILPSSRRRGCSRWPQRRCPPGGRYKRFLSQAAHLFPTRQLPDHSATCRCRYDRPRAALTVSVPPTAQHRHCRSCYERRRAAYFAYVKGATALGLRTCRMNKMVPWPSWTYDHILLEERYELTAHITTDDATPLPRVLPLPSAATASPRNTRDISDVRLHRHSTALCDARVLVQTWDLFNFAIPRR